jgi:hypothetical protein
VGPPADPGRTGRPGPQSRGQYRLADPAPRWRPPGPQTQRPVLAGLSAHPGIRRPGLRRLQRRHHCPATPLRPLRDRDQHPQGAPARRHQAPDRGVGHPGRAQPGRRPRRPLRLVQVLPARHDTKFVTSFDEIFTSMGLRILRSPPRTPVANAFAERWLGTVRRECTDRLLIYNQGHLTHILTEYVRHYNVHRPHRSLDQPPPLPGPVAAAPTGPRVLHRERVLGGLLNEYTYRPAARPEDQGTPT